MEEIDWPHLSAEEKKRQLYLRQKGILDKFLERGAIDHAQYDKSLGDLTEKMGIDPKDSQQTNLVRRRK